MALNIAVKEIANHSYVVDLDGSIDNDSYLDLEKSLTKITREGTKAVYLDMKHVDYVSSAGMGVLVSERKRSNQYSALMAITDLQPMVRKVFDMMKLSSIFFIIDDLPRTDEEINGLLARHLGMPPSQVIH